MVLKRGAKRYAERAIAEPLPYTARQRDTSAEGCDLSASNEGSLSPRDLLTRGAFSFLYDCCPKNMKKEVKARGGCARHRRYFYDKNFVKPTEVS